MYNPIVIKWPYPHVSHRRGYKGTEAQIGGIRTDGKEERRKRRTKNQKRTQRLRNTKENAKENAKRKRKRRTDRICLAKCSLLLNTIRHSPYPLHWNVFAGAGRYRLLPPTPPIGIEPRPGDGSVDILYKVVGGGREEEEKRRRGARKTGDNRQEVRKRKEVKERKMKAERRRTDIPFGDVGDGEPMFMSSPPVGEWLLWWFRVGRDEATIVPISSLPFLVCVVSVSVSV
jgi:hypothetical protein